MLKLIFSIIDIIFVLQLMLKLYWNIGSQPARAVKVLLLIGQLPHETVQMNLKQNQTRKPQFLSLNPLGQIPFLQTENGVGIGESNAIMQYLCQKYPEKLGKYYGEDLQTRTKVNVMLSWYQSYYRPCLFSRIKIKVYGTIKQGIPHTESQLKQADKSIGNALNHLQNFLKQVLFVAGKQITIADLLIYFQTTNLIYYDMQFALKQLEKVSIWYKKISQIPEVRQVQQKWKQTVGGFKSFMNSAKPVSNSNSN